MTTDDTTVQARVDAATEAAARAMYDSWINEYDGDTVDWDPFDDLEDEDRDSWRHQATAALTAAGFPALLAEVAKAEELRIAAVHLLHFFDLNDIFEDGAFNPPTLGEARSRIDRLLRTALATPDREEGA